MRSLLRLIVFLLVAPAAASTNLLVFGDSLSAGYGLPAGAAWPALLQNRLREARLDYSVVNLSISGETSAGGRSRLSAALAQHKPAVLVLALGANDGLRGLPLGQLRHNLEAMIGEARRARTRVLLVGMRLPPNYGPYADEFFRSFEQTARQGRTAYLPFLLEPVAADPAMFQSDRLHPTAAAQTAILDHVWGALRPLL